MSGVSGHSPHSTTLGKNGGRAGPKQTRSRCTTWELSPNIFREKCFTFVVISLGPQSGSYHSSREGGGSVEFLIVCSGPSCYPKLSVQVLVKHTQIADAAKFISLLMYACVRARVHVCACTRFRYAYFA